MDGCASNETPNHAKRKHSSKYLHVNQAVWDWYTMWRNSYILVFGCMLQEEAKLIAEQLEISDLVPSNGWLELTVAKPGMQVLLFRHSKAWMNTEIMTTILSKLNRHLKRTETHILLFMDKAPCLLQTLSGLFSDITDQFLPKSTTSKSQP